MTAAVVGTDLDWFGILACTVVLIWAAGRMALAHVCRQTESWEVVGVLLAVIGEGVSMAGTPSGVPAGLSITAAVVVLVGFPLLLICSARYQDRRFRRTQREWAVIRAAEAAAGIGSASDVGGGW